MSHSPSQKATMAGILVSLGIIYGDIGTSPLYVMKALIGTEKLHSLIVLGGVSCIFWTLTLQTSIKYVFLALNADNRGEGGIFSLFNLMRKKSKWTLPFAIIGAAALMADGIITPPISVSSAVEGLRILQPNIPTIPIVLGILTLIFLFQRFGTAIVGKSFGPMMLFWFGMLGVLGFLQISKNVDILAALNPVYAYRLILENPKGLWILGAIFLCTTGAEALYSDLGHCGKGNIRVSWIFVKITLLLNYLGQGAWLLGKEGQILTQNPFYAIMPEFFLIPGIIISTAAAIIASQALITGSFTLISEAEALNLWPKVKVHYPTESKGQLYVPSVNFLLWAGCVGIVLYFRESTHMEAAYGLSITIAMLMTTILLANYIRLFYFSWTLMIFFLVVYIPLESTFFLANMMKFQEGGFVTFIIGLVLAGIMVLWMKAAQIKGRLSRQVPLKNYLQGLKELSNDTSIPKFATHLVYMTESGNPEEIDTKIIFSIFQKQPKRADVYWFVHIKVMDEPYTLEYKVDILAAQDVVRITFFLGFRVEQRMDYFVKLVVQEMVRNKEIDITSRYLSLRGKDIAGDFHFIMLKHFLSYENNLPVLEDMVMDAYFFLKEFISSKDKWYGLDASSVTIEKVPLVIGPVGKVQLRRVNPPLPVR